MAWTAPMTAIVGAVLTASQWNATVRDNLLETAVAKAANEGGYFIATGVNSLVQRTKGTATINTFETSTSTTFTDLTTVGPSVTVTTGTSALVLWSANARNNTAANYTYCSVEVTGASTVTAHDDRAFGADLSAADEETQLGTQYMYTGLNPGSNTFTMRYRVQGGTGRWGRRHLIVIPF